LGILWLALPWINRISGQDMSVDLILNWKILLPILLTPFLVGLLAGIYPALFMSSFQPVKTLKGLFKSTGGNISFRKILVVAQFSISIILIICTIIVFQQLRYMQTKSLGYNKDHIINLTYYSSISDQYESFRNELLSQPNIKDIARSSRIPTGRLLDNMGAYSMNGDSLQPINAALKYVAIDYHFADNYGLSFAAGRNFSKSYGLDTSNFILNEAAVAAVGWKSPKEAIGKDFKYGNVQGHIIGVVKDFHFESLHQKIAPMIFLLPPPSQSGFFNVLSIKLSGENIPKTLSGVESVWKKWLPDYPCQYSFLDEKFDKLYKSEQKQGSIFTIFSCIAIFIACLGLLGLSAFAISQRVKEIGIRKVLGADLSQIVALISKDFLVFVAVSSIIAFPIAWYAMHHWLQDFAYRISITWWVFLISGIAATLIAFITIVFQTLKAGLANPAKSLRTE
jgi:putative ABC transport system permease protein